MSRIISIVLGTIMFIGWAVTPASAALNVEITQGVSSALPIAIVPFEGETNNVPGGQLLSDVIRNDLQNSGAFRVISPKLFGPRPSDMAQVDFKYWQQQGANDILVGKVQALSGDRYRVTFQLANIYDAPSKQSDAANAVLLSQVYTAQRSGLRALAHHISDLVYQKLTGIRGVFSTKIAYVLVQRSAGKLPQYSLEVADEDGFNPKTLLTSTQPILSPTWSSNGQYIAYVSFENFKPEIYLQALQTGRRQLVSAFSGINSAPAFSPDGKKLALVLTRTGSPKVYVFDLSTRRLAQITQGDSIDTEPAWSPDGKSLLFTSNRGGNPQIYQYTFATNAIERLTFDGNYNAKAQYLPQGQGIVMMHRERGLFGIARQSLAQGDVRVLTRSGSDESPSVAPNGQMVIYATQYAGRGVLAMVSANGRVKLRLPARDGSVQEPAWSPYLEGEKA